MHHPPPLYEDMMAQLFMDLGKGRTHCFIRAAKNQYRTLSKLKAGHHFIYLIFNFHQILILGNVLVSINYEAFLNSAREGYCKDLVPSVLISFFLISVLLNLSSIHLCNPESWISFSLSISPTSYSQALSSIHNGNMNLLPSQSLLLANIQQQLAVFSNCLPFLNSLLHNVMILYPFSSRCQFTKLGSAYDLFMNTNTIVVVVATDTISLVLNEHPIDR